MPIPSRVTKPELADFIDLSVRRIEQLTAAKLIPQPEGGTYPFGATVRAIMAYKHASRDGEESERVLSDQARLLKAQADKAEMDAGRLRGTLVSLDDIAKADERAMSALRDRLLAIPNACADRAVEAAGRSGAKAVSAVVRAEIVAAMADLSTAEAACEKNPGPSTLAKSRASTPRHARLSGRT